MSRSKGISTILRYEDTSPEELEMKIRKQKEYQQVLLQQIETKKLAKQRDDQKRKEEDKLENERIEKDLRVLQERRMLSQKKRMDKIQEMQKVSSFDGVQVIHLFTET